MYDGIFIYKQFIFYINYILNVASFAVVNVSFLSTHHLMFCVGSRTATPMSWCRDENNCTKLVACLLVCFIHVFIYCLVHRIRRMKKHKGFVEQSIWLIGVVHRRAASHLSRDGGWIAACKEVGIIVHREMVILKWASGWCIRRWWNCSFIIGSKWLAWLAHSVGFSVEPFFAFVGT